ncbi:hypothetical protein N0V82_001930 [Gnomoniopsis sp. IMI 355080]|nr:hypothetical protein N0V82_001930 [Gnomoniopsis sp. IMI 355080]
MSNHNAVSAPSPAPSGRGSAVKRERPAVEVNTSVPPHDDASRHSTPASANGPEPKKRKTMPGSRGVANLTPEQLAKKRANATDREAQRAIRERTKLTIENLERKIQDLTSQKPYQELQAALRAKEAVEAENADIKQRLATIMAMMQPIISHSPSEQPALPSPNQSFIPMPSNSTPGPQSTTAHNMSTPSTADHESPPTTADQYTQWNSNTSTSSGPIAAQGQAYKERLDQQRHELAHGLEMGSERLGLGFLLDQSKGPTKSNGVSYEPSAYHQQTIQHGLPTRSSPPYQRLNSVSRDEMHSINIDPALQHAIDPALSGQSDHSIPVKNCAPTCPLDSLLLDFLNERQQRAAEGFPSHEIIGPRYPSVSSLLNPMRDAHPLSKVFIDILHTFPNISRLPERVAVLYVMFLIMRWQIDPSQDNYDRLPDFVRPLPSQLYHQHPAWIDHLPFPAMREKLIRDYAPPDVFPFENFFLPFTTTLSLNWPYEDTDTLLQGPESDELMINPVFERHLRRLENWTLGNAFARTFPMLDGTYGLRTEGSKVFSGNGAVSAAAAGASRNGNAPPGPGES